MDALTPREREVLEMLHDVGWATSGQVSRWVWRGPSSSQCYALLERLWRRRLIRRVRPDWGRGAATARVVWLAPMGYVALGQGRKSVSLPSDGRLRHGLQCTEMLLGRRQAGWIWLRAEAVPQWATTELARLSSAIRTPVEVGGTYDHWRSVTQPALRREQRAVTRMLAISQRMHCDMLWDARVHACHAVLSVTSPSVIRARLPSKTILLLHQWGLIDLEVVTVRDDVWRRLNAWLSYWHPRCPTRFAIHSVPRVF